MMKVDSIHSTKKLVNIYHPGWFIKRNSVGGRYGPSKWTQTQKKCRHWVCIPILHNANRSKRLTRTLSSVPRDQLQALFTTQHTHQQRPRWTRRQGCAKLVLMVEKLCLTYWVNEWILDYGHQTLSQEVRDCHCNRTSSSSRADEIRLN